MYGKSSSSSPTTPVAPQKERFRKYHNPSSSSPFADNCQREQQSQRYRKSSSSSPITDKRSAFHSFRRHRKPSRNAERTTKRSTFRLLLKVPEVFESACNYIYAFHHRHLRIRCTVTGGMVKRDRLQRSSGWVTFF